MSTNTFTLTYFISNAIRNLMNIIKCIESNAANQNSDLAANTYLVTNADK